MPRRFTLLVGSLVLAIVPISPGQEEDACRITSLPAAVQQLLGTRYADWRPKDTSDLGTDDRQLWLHAHPKECPGIAIGHFERADQVSYAVLLVRKSQLSHGYRIIVLVKISAKDGYADRVLDQNDSQGPDTGMVVSTAPHGSYSDFEETTSVQLNLDAVNIEWIEKGAVIYYWAHGKYNTLQTSD